MNAEYIEQHMTNVHTPESFGRSVIAHALKAAKKELGAKVQSSVNISATIEVSEVPARQCVRVCVIIAGAEICTHIGV